MDKFSKKYLDKFSKKNIDKFSKKNIWTNFQKNILTNKAGSSLVGWLADGFSFADVERYRYGEIIWPL